jgi:hypothetical protein
MFHRTAILLALTLATCSLRGAEPSVEELNAAARRAFATGDRDEARQYLASAAEAVRDAYAKKPSWRAQYQLSGDLVGVALEHLRANELDAALVVLGAAADLDVPLRKGLDNGLGNAAAGLNRQLALLDSDERFELLHAWSMPTDSRPTVRLLQSFTPTVSPPPVFARAFGERPRDSSFAIASVGEVNGLFSTAWELVRAADEAGRLRRLRNELEKLVEDRAKNAAYVLTLARVVEAKRADQALKSELATHLSLLRENQPISGKSRGFDAAWQYGHGKYDEQKQRTIDFKPFEHWTGAAWQIAAKRPHSGFGFLRIDQTGGHPSPNRVCIRRWTAPEDGVLTIAGKMDRRAEEGDGVRGRVISSRTGSLGEVRALDGPTEMRIVGIQVRVGETIDFLADIIDNNYYDTFVWMFQLQLKTDDKQRIYDSVADFCGPRDKSVLSDAVLAAACLEREWLQPISRDILGKLIENTYCTDKWINRPHEYNSQVIRPALRRVWATAVRKGMGEASPDLLEDAGLKYWVRSSESLKDSRSAATWLGYENHVLHLSGSQRDQLFFRYPVTGDFEFSFETQTAGRPGTDGGVVFGDTGYELNVADELFIGVTDRGRIEEPFSQLTSHAGRFHGQHVGPPEFNRFELASAGGRMTFSSNRKPIWSHEAGGSTAPWIALQAHGDRNPIFRNLQLTGELLIPDEVRLSSGDSLRGWTDGAANRFQFADRSESSLKERQEPEKARVSNANFRIPYFLASDEILAPHIIGGQPTSRTVDSAPNWSAANGVIHGRRKEGSGNESAQSYILYRRPLLGGESISYEFLYEPGKLEVHPALGRLAFLIEPDGVRLHWITDGDREWTGLAKDNAVVERFDRRGPKPLPLNAAEWNRMNVELSSGKVTLSLNDVVIYQRKLQSHDSRSFGFYHDANKSSAEVRSVVLRGDWPDRLTEEHLNNLAAVSESNRNRADRFALNALFGDEYIAGDVIATRARAAAMSPEERYDVLLHWVLPSRDHATYRLYGAFGPTNPALPVADFTIDEIQRLDEAAENRTGRIQTGGGAIAPALDLISVAKQLSRLDVLRERIQSEAGQGDTQTRRSQLAMLILIDIAREEFAEADEHLEEFRKLAVEPPFLAHARWPEMLVFFEGLRHRETYQLVGESVISITESQIRHGEGTGSDLHDRHLLALTGPKRHLDEHDSIEPYLDDSRLKQWTPVSKVTAKSRGQGMPVARWSVADSKSVFSYAGHDNDFLYFQSPLRGNYQIDCEVTRSGGWLDTAIAIGGQWVVATWDMKFFNRGDFRKQVATHPITPHMWKRIDVPYMHYRVDVRDQVATTFINGRKIREEKLGEDYDPWMAIRSEHNRHGGVHDLRITGDPIIPAEVKLLHDTGLTGWTPYYDETVGSEDSDWRYDRDELIGQRGQTEESDRESLVYYHRPMLEDGSISYEFFYEPNESVAHPALDRLALLLDPSGVRVHWCTDGLYDRTRLPPSNIENEPEHRRGPDQLPLKAGAWNRVKLTLTGDTIGLTLNGQLVYQRRLEATNLRQFGLFHYSDRTEARVRNVVWQGNWPKQLPSLADQELADISLIAKLDAKLPTMQVFEHDFAKNALRSDVLELPAGNPAATMSPTEDGLHLTVPGTDPNRWHDHHIHHRFSLTGDFDITASFEQFKAEFPKQHKYAGVALVAILESKPFVNLWIHRRRSGSKENHQYIETTSQHPGPEGDVRWDTWKNRPNESSSGTLRLVRRGKTVYHLYADGDSTQFRLHRTQELTDAPVRMNGLWLFTQVGGIGQASVVWKSVKVRADEIVYAPKRNAVPLPAVQPERREKKLLESVLDLFR